MRDLHSGQDAWFSWQPGSGSRWSSFRCQTGWKASVGGSGAISHGLWHKNPRNGADQRMNDERTRQFEAQDQRAVSALNFTKSTPGDSSHNKLLMDHFIVRVYPQC